MMSGMENIVLFFLLWLQVKQPVGSTGKYIVDVPANSPYRMADPWARIPEGTPTWGGAVSWVAVDANSNVYVLRRNAPNVVVFDANGKFLRSWGDGLFKWAHGIRVDRNGFVWATDGQDHLVYKFTNAGTLVLKLGEKGVPGNDGAHFNRPTDVAVAPNGDFFVSDGYGNSRVAKFSADGKFIRMWGTKGTGPGEFNLPHAVVIDGRGRVIVADRQNNRIQVFDQDGKFLDMWGDCGKPYGLELSTDDKLYVADADTGNIAVLDAKSGKKVDTLLGIGEPHGIAIDRLGNLYAAMVDNQILLKLVPRK